MALTKVTGEFIDIGDIDISDVGTISLDAIQGDADANTSITFSGSDVITIATGGSGRLTIGDGALSPVTDNQIDLGTSSLEFKDGYFDGTVTADAFAGPLTGDVTGNASGTAATVTGAAQSAITSLGTLTTLTVDDITINGSTISDGGDLTIESAGEMILKQGGGIVRVYAGSTQVGALTTSSNNFALKSFVSDKDIYIIGNDGGSTITACTFDMSDAGTAIFNNQVGIGATPATAAGISKYLYVEGGDPGIVLKDSTANDVAEIYNAAGKLIIYGGSGGTNADSFAFDIPNNRLGIGTMSPARNLVVSSSGQTDVAIVAGTSASAQLQFGDSGDDNIGQIEYNNSTNNMMFYANATEHMRINSNGNINIGIGGSGGDLLLQPQAKLYLDAGGDTYIVESSGNEVDVYTGGARRLRVNQDGLIFNSDTAGANALDDYEEGTFTPTYTVDGGGSAGTVTSTNVGTYTKVGNIVHCAVRSHYVPTSGTIPTSYNMTLPFQAKNTGGQAGNGSGQEVAQTGKSMFISVGGNATTGIIKATDGAAPPANAYFDFGFTYHAA